MKKADFLILFSRFVTALIFGGAFYVFTEIGQPSLMQFTGGKDCCERCSNFLFDAAQPTLVFSAFAAFLLYNLFGEKTLSFINSLKTAAFCILAFQIYTVWLGWHLLLRTPCTALYSPGQLIIVGIFFLVRNVLIESLVWASFCAIPMLTLNLIWHLLSKKSLTEISLNNP